MWKVERRIGMEKSDKAVELFKGGLCCSQAVFCAFAEDFGMDAETARKVSAGLGGGVAIIEPEDVREQFCAHLKNVMEAL